MEAKLDGELCTGCGLCVDICPEVFEMGEENMAVVKGVSIPENAEECCQEAKDSCPVEAIDID